MRKWARDAHQHSMPLSFARTGFGAGTAYVQRQTDDNQLRILDSPSGQFGNQPRTVDHAGVSQSPLVTSSPTVVVLPSWIPVIGSNIATYFADFTTEGNTNHYLFNNGTFNGFSAWLTGISGAFSRSSSAYYFNSSGVLTSAANNVLRFDYNPTSFVSRGILIEGAATNLVLHSGDPSDAYWTILAAAVTIVGNAAVAPDGTTTAASFTETTANSVHQIATNVPPNITPGTSYTISCFAKPAGGRFLGLSLGGSSASGDGGYCFFDLQAGTAGTAAGLSSGGGASNPVITPLINGWFRLSVTAHTTTDASAYLIVSSATSANPSVDQFGRQVFVGSTSNIFDVWGLQYEQSTFVSSYIVTTGSTASRSADSLTFPYVQTTLIAFSQVFNQHGTGANQILVLDGANNQVLSSQISQGGFYTFNNVSSLVQSGSLPDLTATHKVASSGSPATRNIALDGGNYNSANSAFIAGTPTTATVGKSNDVFLMNIFDIGIFNGITATQAQLQSLTT